MKITHHTSGSKANTFHIHATNHIIIDVSIKSLPCDILCLTHTHGDHMGRKPYTNFVYYLKQCKAFVTTLEVFEDVKSKFKGNKLVTQLLNEKYHLDGFCEIYDKEVRITPFKLYHDVPCAGFIIEDTEKYIHITDTVKVDVTEEMKNPDYISIEANYDEGIRKNNIINGRRIAFVNERLKDRGHLENTVTRKILGQIVGDKTKTIGIIHVSGDNNHELLIKSVMKDYEIIIPKGVVEY